MTDGSLGVTLNVQTARLIQANGRVSDLIAIADTCEAHQRAVLIELNPPPWYETLGQRLLHPKAKTAPSAVTP